MKKKHKPVAMRLRETWTIKPLTRIKKSGKIYSRKKYSPGQEP